MRRCRSLKRTHSQKKSSKKNQKVASLGADFSIAASNDLFPACVPAAAYECLRTTDLDACAADAACEVDSSVCFSDACPEADPCCGHGRDTCAGVVPSSEVWFFLFFCF